MAMEGSLISSLAAAGAFGKLADHYWGRGMALRDRIIMELELFECETKDDVTTWDFDISINAQARAAKLLAPISSVYQRLADASGLDGADVVLKAALRADEGVSAALLVRYDPSRVSEGSISDFMLEAEKLTLEAISVIEKVQEMGGADLQSVAVLPAASSFVDTEEKVIFAPPPVARIVDKWRAEASKKSETWIAADMSFSTGNSVQWKVKGRAPVMDSGDGEERLDLGYSHGLRDKTWMAYVQLEGQGAEMKMSCGPREKDILLDAQKFGKMIKLLWRPSVLEENGGFRPVGGTILSVEWASDEEATHQQGALFDTETD